MGNLEEKNLRLQQLLNKEPQSEIKQDQQQQQQQQFYQINQLQQENLELKNQLKEKTEQTMRAKPITTPSNYQQQPLSNLPPTQYRQNLPYQQGNQNMQTINNRGSPNKNIFDFNQTRPLQTHFQYEQQYPIIVNGTDKKEREQQGLLSNVTYMGKK
eukprot:TRINITY_DN1856_c0_g1_i1.p1 TRINITY_DN1856_c0_g1~~TRINITY_DN1856_c0_g1_i1.p1  ORF type:complete len:157 (+),score=30.19 TRINITY_DN1856_c0_g1_i1:2-472(+)